MLKPRISDRTKRRRKRREVDEILKRVRLRNHNFVNNDRIFTLNDQSKETCVHEINFPICNEIINTVKNRVDTNDRQLQEFHFSNSEKPLDAQVGIPIDLALREWALKHNIKQLAIGDLLKIYRKQENYPNLPLDPRTLMCTPTQVKTSMISGGKYVYFGIRKQLVVRMKCGYLENANRSSNI